jgi:D-cysteine desulfhydrase
VIELPRLRLAALPTPLERAERLEKALGSSVPVWVKRDDLTGFALAGNKARKLELLAADALSRGCDVLLTGGRPGSNHCQATAAAAAAAGLECRLVLTTPDPQLPPNLRLARFFGAQVTFTGEADPASVDRGIEEAEEELVAAGRSPYPIPRGGATALGAVGYALAARELADQLSVVGAEPRLVVVATGSCGTQAGLIAGAVELGRPWRVVGACVSRPPGECRERVLRLARDCAVLMQTPQPVADDVDVRDARGPGHGLPSEDGRAAAALLARTEGLLLDHVFTAKAMGVLLGILRDGHVGPVAFVHTGGTAALFDVGGIA